MTIHQPATVEISVVIPVYRSEDIVATTVSETLHVLRDLGEPFEVVLVNDGSPDGSWNVIAALAVEHREVIAVDLLRNYGQHSAVLCGLAAARGRYVLTIDDDMQNPPSELPKLIDVARSGDHDLVVGRFNDKRHSLIRRWGSRVVAAINRRVFGNPADIEMTNVRCIRRDVVDRIVAYRTTKPYVTGLSLKYAASPVNVTIEHRDRAVGSSNYSPLTIASLVFRILFTYSSWPLRLVSNIGIAISLLSFLYGAYILARAVLVGTSIPGWATVVVLLAFFNGISILILGMLGEYMIRVLNQVSSEQPYEIGRVVGASDASR